MDLGLASSLCSFTLSVLHKVSARPSTPFFRPSLPILLAQSHAIVPPRFEEMQAVTNLQPQGQPSRLHPGQQGGRESGTDESAPPRGAPAGLRSMVTGGEPFRINPLSRLFFSFSSMRWGRKNWWFGCDSKDRQASAAPSDSSTQESGNQ